MEKIINTTEGPDQNVPRKPGFPQLPGLFPDEKTQLATINKPNQAVKSLNSSISPELMNNPLFDKNSIVDEMGDEAIQNQLASNQSVAGLFRRGIGNFANTALFETLKVGGVVAGLLKNGYNMIDPNTQAKTSDIWDNSIYKYLDEVQQGNANSDFLKVYKSAGYEDASALGKLSHGAWWADTFANGAGFMASMIVPGQALKSLSLGGKVLSLVEGTAGLANKAAKGIGLIDASSDLLRISNMSNVVGETLQATRKALTLEAETLNTSLKAAIAKGDDIVKISEDLRKVNSEIASVTKTLAETTPTLQPGFSTKFINGAENVTASFTSGVIEASAEGYSAQHETFDKLMKTGKYTREQAIQMASDKAANVFKQNIALLMASNMLDELLVFKWFNKSTNPESLAKKVWNKTAGIEDVVPKTILGKVNKTRKSIAANKYTKAIGGFVVESLKEGWEESAQKNISDNASTETGSTSIFDSTAANIIDSGITAIADAGSFAWGAAKDMLGKNADDAIAGAVLGGLMGGIGQARRLSAEEDMVKGFGDRNKKLFGIIKARQGRSGLDSEYGKIYEAINFSKKFSDLEKQGKVVDGKISKDEMDKLSEEDAKRVELALKYNTALKKGDKIAISQIEDTIITNVLLKALPQHSDDIHMIDLVADELIKTFEEQHKNTTVSTSVKRVAEAIKKTKQAVDRVTPINDEFDRLLYQDRFRTTLAQVLETNKHIAIRDLLSQYNLPEDYIDNYESYVSYDDPGITYTTRERANEVNGNDYYTKIGVEETNDGKFMNIFERKGIKYVQKENGQYAKYNKVENKEEYEKSYEELKKDDLYPTLIAQNVEDQAQQEMLIKQYGLFGMDGQRIYKGTSLQNYHKKEADKYQADLADLYDKDKIAERRENWKKGVEQRTAEQTFIDSIKPGEVYVHPVHNGYITKAENGNFYYRDVNTNKEVLPELIPRLGFELDVEGKAKKELDALIQHEERLLAIQEAHENFRETYKNIQAAEDSRKSMNALIQEGKQIAEDYVQWLEEEIEFMNASSIYKNDYVDFFLKKQELEQKLANIQTKLSKIADGIKKGKATRKANKTAKEKAELQKEKERLIAEIKIEEARVARETKKAKELYLANLAAITKIKNVQFAELNANKGLTQAQRKSRSVEIFNEFDRNKELIKTMTSTIGMEFEYSSLTEEFSELEMSILEQQTVKERAAELTKLEKERVAGLKEAERLKIQVEKRNRRIDLRNRIKDKSKKEQLEDSIERIYSVKYLEDYVYNEVTYKGVKYILKPDGVRFVLENENTIIELPFVSEVPTFEEYGIILSEDSYNVNTKYRVAIISTNQVVIDGLTYTVVKNSIGNIVSLTIADKVFKNERLIITVEQEFNRFTFQEMRLKNEEMKEYRKTEVYKRQAALLSENFNSVTETAVVKLYENTYLNDEEWNNVHNWVNGVLSKVLDNKENTKLITNLQFLKSLLHETISNRNIDSNVQIKTEYTPTTIEAVEESLYEDLSNLPENNIGKVTPTTPEERVVVNNLSQKTNREENSKVVEKPVNVLESLKKQLEETEKALTDTNDFEKVVEEEPTDETLSTLAAFDIAEKKDIGEGVDEIFEEEEATILESIGWEPESKTSIVQKTIGVDIEFKDGKETYVQEKIGSDLQIGLLDDKPYNKTRRNFFATNNIEGRKGRIFAYNELPEEAKEHILENNKTFTPTENDFYILILEGTDYQKHDGKYVITTIPKSLITKIAPKYDEVKKYLSTKGGKFMDNGSTITYTRPDTKSVSLIATYSEDGSLNIDTISSLALLEEYYQETLTLLKSNGQTDIEFTQQSNGFGYLYKNAAGKPVDRELSEIFKLEDFEEFSYVKDKKGAKGKNTIKLKNGSMIPVQSVKISREDALNIIEVISKAKKDTYLDKPAVYNRKGGGKFEMAILSQYYPFGTIKGTDKKTDLTKQQMFVNGGKLIIIAAKKKGMVKHVFDIANDVKPTNEKLISVLTSITKRLDAISQNQKYTVFNGNVLESKEGKQLMLETFTSAIVSKELPVVGIYNQFNILGKHIVEKPIEIVQSEVTPTIGSPIDTTINKPADKIRPVDKVNAPPTKTVDDDIIKNIFIKADGSVILTHFTTFKGSTDIRESLIKKVIEETELPRSTIEKVTNEYVDLFLDALGNAFKIQLNNAIKKAEKQMADVYEQETLDMSILDSEEKNTVNVAINNMIDKVKNGVNDYYLKLSNSDKSKVNQVLKGTELFNKDMETVVEKTPIKIEPEVTNQVEEGGVRRNRRSGKSSIHKASAKTELNNPLDILINNNVIEKTDC